jgi:hypothetical protein
VSTQGKEIIAKVRVRAAANPDFVYKPVEGSLGVNTCLYVKNGAPSCLIGCGLWDVELITAELEHDETYVDDDSVLNETGAEELLAYLGTRLDRDEIDWLECVQSRQDRGTPWQIAVNKADDAYPQVAA